MIFLYRPYPTASTTATGGVLYRPEIPIRVHGPLGSKLLRALVDSGSDDTILPLPIAQNIGAKIDASHRWRVEGFGGNALDAIVGEIDFELVTPAERFWWTAKVGLIEFTNSEDEFAILGHAGFLDFFIDTFDGGIHAVELLPAPAFPGMRS
jgi:hypothetical protein